MLTMFRDKAVSAHEALEELKYHLSTHQPISAVAAHVILIWAQGRDTMYTSKQCHTGL